MRHRSLRQLDEALIRLRRLFQTPSLRTTKASTDTAVELSTVFVADAIDRSRRDEPGHVIGVGAVARMLSVTASTASRLVDRAVKAGVVQRGTDPADPRRAALGLTLDGRRLLAAATDFRLDYLDRVLSQWDPDEVQLLSRLLDRFAADVTRLGPPGRGAR